MAHMVLNTQISANFLLVKETLEFLFWCDEKLLLYFFSFTHVHKPNSCDYSSVSKKRISHADVDLVRM